MSAFCIFLSEIATVDHLQRIHDVRTLLSSRIDALMFLSVSGIHIHFINVLAYNHTIKLVNTGAGTCLSSEQ